MVYVLIGVILLVIILPIIAVLPSARQKEQMRMRTAARKAGITVELVSIDDPNPKQEKYISYTGRPIEPRLKVAAYKLQRKREVDWRLLPEVDWMLVRDLEGNWHWKTPPQTGMNPDLVNWLDERVNGLPADVVQVEENRYMLCVYWHERVPGSEQLVFDFLGECAEIPLFIVKPDMTAE